MSEPNTKPWWKSRTIQAAVISFVLNVYAAAVPLAATFGVTLPEIPSALLMVLNTFFGGMIVYGRVDAKATITKK